MPRRNRGFSHGARRTTSWIGPAEQGYVSVATTGATLVASLSSSNLDTGTIIRTRGQVSVGPQDVTADLAIVGAFGIGMVSTQAFGIGITAIPHPFRDADWDGWMVWRSFSYQFEFQDATGVNFPAWDFEVDSKAMRKLEGDYTMVLVAESFTGAFVLSAPLRHLLKLP